MWGTLLTWIAFLLAWDCYWIQSDCIHHRDRMHGFDQRGFHDVLLGRHLIVGLNVALKRPFPLVGESELARESEMARAIWCDFTPIFFCEEHQKLTHDFLASVVPTTFLVIIDFYLRSKNSSS
jgi:hypothetical protein